MSISITREGSNLVIASPYNTAIISALTRLGGRWNPVARVWAVPATVETEVRELLTQNFGTDGEVVADLVTFEIVCDEHSQRCGPTYWNRRPIVAARDRDSGARPCEGVSLLAETILSGGSRANWTTVIEEGAALRIAGVPRAWLDSPPSFSSEIRLVETPHAIDLEGLRAERQRLIARIEVIDDLLAQQTTS